VALDSMTRRACLLPYAGTGLAFNAANAGGTYWYHGIQVGPGIKALRAMCTISRTGLSTAGTPAEFWTEDSGATANDKILVESPQSGNLIYPPSDFSQVVNGSEAWVATPGQATYRLCEITADREPRHQQVYGRYYCGWGFRSLPFEPPTGLP
jgi:hypothetical protein